MKELIKASKKIEKILINAESKGESFDVTLGKLSGPKVHGVVFPTLMLLKLWMILQKIAINVELERMMMFKKRMIMLRCDGIKLTNGKTNNTRRLDV